MVVVVSDAPFYSNAKRRHTWSGLMVLFKYCCATIALTYLVTALLPTNFIAPSPSWAGAVGPEWIGRAISTVYFLLLGTIFYGLQRRRPIYWRLIPILLTTYLLGVAIPALWTYIRLELPWRPFLIIFVFIFIGMLGFMAWWRNQKNHFV